MTAVGTALAYRGVRPYINVSAIMTTFFLAKDHPLAISKLFWIKANRVLAWSLIVSPPLQWLFGMAFMTGLWIDLGILLVHAALSLILFGTPATKTKAFKASMHLFGFRAADLTGRNKFLLTGYRIALAIGALLLMFTPLAWFALVALYPILRLAVTIVQHIFEAVLYAMARWGRRAIAENVAIAIVVLYFAVSLVNLVR